MKAAHVCKEAYDLYLRSLDGGANDDDQHPLTIMLCSIRTDDPELRIEFIKFIHDDEPLSQLPLLQVVRAKLKFIPCNERLIEKACFVPLFLS